MGERSGGGVGFATIRGVLTQSRHHSPTHKVHRNSQQPNKTIRLPSFITALPFRFG
jgi:hypothetical protein